MISKLIFGDDGIANADTSFSFNLKSVDILGKITKYPKFSQYFQKRLKPVFESYVNTPYRNSSYYIKLPCYISKMFEDRCMEVVITGLPEILRGTALNQNAGVRMTRRRSAKFSVVFWRIRRRYVIVTNQVKIKRNRFDQHTAV